MGTALRRVVVFAIYGLVALAAAPASAEGFKISVVDAPSPASRTARVSIVGRAPSSLKLQSAPGSDVAPPALEHDGNTELEVAIGTQLNVRPTSAEAPVPLGRHEKRSFSGKVIVGTRNVKTGRATVWRFQPVVLAKLVPLQWDPTAKGYLTTIEVGLDAEEADARLVTPVTFEILGEHIERVEPDQITITAPGPGGYTTARILTTHYVPSVKISVHSPAGDAAFEADVDPGLAIALTASQSTIPAFGLGTTLITLSCSKADGTDGSALATCAGHHLATTTQGRLDPTDIELKAGVGPVHVTLYSASLGTTTVSVEGLPALHIELVWPWSLFFAGLAGAFIGAGLRLLGRRRKHWRAMFLGSVVTGVIIDVLLTLGVPLIHGLQEGIMTNEGGWFAIGVLGGVLGTQALVRIARKLFGIGDNHESAPADPEPGNGAGTTKAMG